MPFLSQLLIFYLYYFDADTYSIQELNVVKVGSVSILKIYRWKSFLLDIRKIFKRKCSINKYFWSISQIQT